LPADGINAAFNWRDYGWPRWQLADEVTAFPDVPEGAIVCGSGCGAARRSGFAGADDPAAECLGRLAVAHRCFAGLCGEVELGVCLRASIEGPRQWQKA
jgi:hypothetical protein